MSYADWRSPAAYDRAMGLEPTGFAWEWLRRNPAYRRDLRDAEPGQDFSATLRTRWGLSFCG
jgi:hypothetical protein